MTYFLIGILALIAYGITTSYHYHTMDWKKLAKTKAYFDQNDSFWIKAAMADWIFARVMIGLPIILIWPAYAILAACFYVGKILAQRKK
jgi:hypothetical protein